MDVWSIFGSIKRDYRHTNIIVAEEGWIAERDFSAWAMAYVGERGSMRVISANSDLQQFVERGNLGASGLIEMMKFILLDM